VKVLFNGHIDPPVPVVIDAKVGVVDLNNQLLHAHCRLTVHPAMYYVGIVNPRRDTNHVVTEKDEQYLRWNSSL